MGTAWKPDPEQIENYFHLLSLEMRALNSYRDKFIILLYEFKVFIT